MPNAHATTYLIKLKYVNSLEQEIYDTLRN